jgi:hypothetical protein
MLQLIYLHDGQSGTLHMLAEIQQPGLRGLELSWSLSARIIFALGDVS